MEGEGRAAPCTILSCIVITAAAAATKTTTNITRVVNRENCDKKVSECVEGERIATKVREEEGEQEKYDETFAEPDGEPCEMHARYVRDIERGKRSCMR